MILHLNKLVNTDILNEIKKKYDAFHFSENEIEVVITSSSVKEVDTKFEKFVKEKFLFDSDIQLASLNYKQKREINIGGKIIGGNTNNCIIITGPCSVESEQQIEKVSKFISRLNIHTLRGGCYKPRTSPYTFQGMELDGLKLLKNAKNKYGFSIITEVRDSTHVNDVIEHADIIQIGAKAMYDHGILKACAKTKKTVMIKRGFGTTLQEFVQAAEFILSGGNPNVILCERGIRTFETKTRFTLDLCGVAYLKHHTNLPIIIDPSHALGYAYGIEDLSKACIAMGVDGLIIETHPNPSVAKSDAKQQLNFEQFEKLHKSISNIANAIGVNII